MGKFDSLVPEHVRALSRYTPGKHVKQAERESGVSCIKMASNENPFGPSPKALEAIRTAAAAVNFYPDNEVTELRQRLAERHGVATDQVLVMDGTTALLDLMARALLGPGLNAVTSERSFIVYPIVTLAAGGRLTQVPMRGHAYNLDGIAASVDANTRLVFLANPNNPTGSMFDADETDRFLARMPEHVITVLDEAYCDFAEDYARRRGITYSRSMDYVRQGRNVVVLRTFSKAHGLAGMRVGYGLGPQELLAHLARLRTAFSVSTVAEAAALAALDDEQHIQRAIENNATGAAWLSDEIRKLGMEVAPTSASFLYVETGEEAGALARRIQAEGVIVRPLGAWGAPNALRVTVGTPQQNQRFLEALKKVAQKTAVR